MKNEKIRVGLIGLGGWAKYGHIPALQALAEDYEIVAVSSRRQAQADAYAAQFHIKHAFHDAQALVSCPEVDLVVVLAPAMEHARLAKLAIAAGKDVYSEWPLTTSTADSAELLALAEARGANLLEVSVEGSRAVSAVAWQTAEGPVLWLANGSAEPHAGKS